ncbi:malolactic enzyme [Lacticaseibacillus daqingensis]|uniref:malolactic enzyme n=1 Tax=Lacticaseibacillus daqingensis TaxID=2486014 RepID=UPI000F77FC11|nr:malolactic enzyme [Lacticaseibacillus daqingensis]
MIYTLQQLLHDPFLNKGTAFTQAERDAYGLNGLLPPSVQTLAQQVAAAYAQYSQKPTDLAKRQFLMQLFNVNHVLFYRLFAEHVAEFMPVVYDPTIAETIEHYSAWFVEPQNATYLSIDDQEHLEAALRHAANGRDIRLIVVTDAEGILGIGDWGTQGVDIAVGKLMVYTAAAGIDPSQVLPVVLDAGTNNPALLADPQYLGVRHARVAGPTYRAFVDRFVSAATGLFPKLYLHWEDFGRANAADILAQYQDQLTTFNDDIQGTGIIVLAGLLGALNISGQKLTDQVYVCFGAGTAGAGIVARVCAQMQAAGLSEKAARARFYLVDKQGLLFADDPTLTPAQRPFARDRREFTAPETLTDLAHVVAAVHPTVLVGTSTQPGAFTEPLIRDMAAHTPRPVIFPISNPTKLMEATAADLIRWTEGRALVATGIPSAPVTDNGVTYTIGQANNALIYPGLGLGTIAVASSRLSDGMIAAAAHSLSGLVDPTAPGAAVLPPVKDLAHFSCLVAEAVAKAAVAEGLNQQSVTDVAATVAAAQWHPDYQPLPETVTVKLA